MRDTFIATVMARWVGVLGVILGAGCNALLGVDQVHASREDAAAADAATIADAATDGPLADGAVTDAATFDAPVFDAKMFDAPPPDAMPPLVLAMDIPLRVAVSDAVPISFTVQGAPSSVLSWSISSGGGTFQPSSGQVATNGAGSGVINVTYTAPATEGDLAHVLALTGQASSNTPFVTKVRVLRVLGEVTPFPDNAGIQLSAGYLYGQTVFIDKTTVVMRLGLISQTGGFNGRMALYTNGASVPKDLVAGTALDSIPSVAKELRVVTPTQVTSGTYWIMGNFDASAPLKRDVTRSTGQAYVPLATTAALPASLASPTAVTNRVINFYVLVAD